MRGHRRGWQRKPSGLEIMNSRSPRDFWELLPKYVWHMEEPVCEPPAIALYYISKLAREHVTVLLSARAATKPLRDTKATEIFCAGKIKRGLGHWRLRREG